MLFTKRWRALLTCACFTLPLATFAASAQAGFADNAPVGGARVSEALRLADAHWGAAPCSGSATLTWSAQAPHVNAVSSWSNTGDPYAAWGDNFDCKITMNPAAEWSWPKFCTVVVHEVGHLEGRPHSDDPKDVMAPYYTRPVPECSKTPDPQAPAVVAQPVAKPRSAKATSTAKKAAKSPVRGRAAARARGARHHVAHTSRV